jgi:hypothetical protein
MSQHVVLHVPRHCKEAQTPCTIHFNYVQKPDEKFRSINLANEKVKLLVTSLVGGLRFLRAAGFVKDDATNTMILPPVSDAVTARLTQAVRIIDEEVAKGIFA